MNEPWQIEKLKLSPIYQHHFTTTEQLHTNKPCHTLKKGESGILLHHDMGLQASAKSLVGYGKVGLNKRLVRSRSTLKGNQKKQCWFNLNEQIRLFSTFFAFTDLSSLSYCDNFIIGVLKQYVGHFLLFVYCTFAPNTFRLLFIFRDLFFPFCLLPMLLYFLFFLQLCQGSNQGFQFES